MFTIPLDLALDYTRQMIATKLGHEPTGSPITLAVIRERADVGAEISDRELTHAILQIAFTRIRQG